MKNTTAHESPEKFSDYTHQQLLLNSSRFHDKIMNLQNNARSHEKYCSARAALFSIILSIVTFWPSIEVMIPSIIKTFSMPFISNSPLQIFLAYFHLFLLAFLAISALVSLYSFFKYRKCRKCENDISEVIEKAAKESIKYTAIIVIADGTTRSASFLLGKSHKEDYKYFLPYVRIDSNASIDECIDSIRRELGNTYGINQTDILDIYPYSRKPSFSIKRMETSALAEAHAFVFFAVHLNYNLKRYLKTQKGNQWATIDQMKNNPNAIANNGDVIKKLLDIIETHTLDDSFTNNHTPLKIIWNITKSCNYNCSFCATKNDDCVEMTGIEKLKALNNITTLRNQIIKLDFSGGDPCINNDSLDIINTAISILGSSVVSVTTTGEGINVLAKNQQYDCKSILRNCEITIDAYQKDIKGLVRRDNAHEYCANNIEAVIKHIANLEKITINVPLISDHLSSKELNKLIERIRQIKKYKVSVSVNLIRLMPVGMMSIQKYPTKYNPQKLINRIIKQLRKDGIPVSLHCSLRYALTKDYEEDTKLCGMGAKKIGIDYAGNVFSCAWAGYLQDQDYPGKILEPKDNPFFLGNVLKMPLDRILCNDNPLYSNLIARITKHPIESLSFCPVVSYSNSKDKTWYNNNDPLSKINN